MVPDSNCAQLCSQRNNERSGRSQGGSQLRASGLLYSDTLRVDLHRLQVCQPRAAGARSNIVLPVCSEEVSGQEEEISNCDCTTSQRSREGGFPPEVRERRGGLIALLASEQSWDGEEQVDVAQWTDAKFTNNASSPRPAASQLCHKWSKGPRLSVPRVDSRPGRERGGFHQQGGGVVPESELRTSSHISCSIEPWLARPCPLVLQQPWTSHKIWWLLNSHSGKKSSSRNPSSSSLVQCRTGKSNSTAHLFPVSQEAGCSCKQLP